MRITVCTASGEHVDFDGDHIAVAVDGDGELFITVHGAQPAIFARGRWDYVRPVNESAAPAVPPPGIRGA